ncbi:MAG: VapC toxin family PIN domain ribonuclease [Phyllobacteriaceae bacterium]|nr:VapC toxin family PIN domain ribonuclease [Phyllobacteriaceae bacterium]
MIPLYDVNALLALFTPGHPFSGEMRNWHRRHGDHGWATCPITQNAFIRIGSQPSFPQRQPIGLVRAMLQTAISLPGHRFWPDDISIAHDAIFDCARIRGHRQITDAYLLAIAARNGGRLVTFDQTIDHRCVRDAKPENLVVIA